MGERFGGMAVVAAAPELATATNVASTAVRPKRQVRTSALHPVNGWALCPAWVAALPHAAPVEEEPADEETPSPGSAPPQGASGPQGGQPHANVPPTAVLPKD